MTFPEDYGAGELAGREASFAVTVKEVKEKQLPELERRLRGRRRLRRPRGAARRHPRAAARGRARAHRRPSTARPRSTPPSRNATVPVTPELVSARAREMWERNAALARPPRHLARGLPADHRPHRGGDPRRGCSREAEQALRREAVITAVVAAEGIAPEDDDVLAALDADRRARGRRAADAARGSARRRAPRGRARGPRRARGDRPDRLRGEADPARAGRGAREAVDAREGRRGEGASKRAAEAGRLWTPDR